MAYLHYQMIMTSCDSSKAQTARHIGHFAASERVHITPPGRKTSQLSKIKFSHEVGGIVATPYSKTEFSLSNLSHTRRNGAGSVSEKSESTPPK